MKNKLQYKLLYILCNSSNSLMWLIRAKMTMIFQGFVTTEIAKSSTGVCNLDNIDNNKSIGNVEF